MRILITGGFGSIGVTAVNECLRRGHQVSVFEVETGRTRKLKRKYGRKNVSVYFGDIRNTADVSKAVEGSDAVIHMAGILPPASESNPELCRSVNIGGTENIIGAVKQYDCKLVFVSSASVMGPTQEKEPPVNPEQALSPTDNYSESKAAAEQRVEASGLDYCILRLAAVLPTILNFKSIVTMIRLFFDMPLEARCEVVTDIDVAAALVTCAELLHRDSRLPVRKGFIAGGAANGCRMKTADLVALIFNTVGLPGPDESLFSTDINSYYLDWYDTIDIQKVLNYQNYSLEQWKRNLVRITMPLRPLIFVLRPVIMNWMERQSPRYGMR